jgi:type IX secretion system PorP/SprF family membrane protein
MKKIYLIIVLFVGLISYAQQDAQYTQYMYNTMSVNPAYAGSRGALSIAALHRSQWVGLDGAPNTQTFNIHSPVSNSVGLGLSIVNDKIGPTSETNFDGMFSYTIPTSVDGQLSFGIKAGVHLLNIDYNRLSRYQDEPGTLGNNVNNQLSPNIGAGVYYHADKFYVGLSVPNILETKHLNDDTFSVAKERMNFYLIAGHVFDLSPSLQLKPALLTKMVNGAPLQVDVSANFWYNEKITLGVAYRWSAAWSALAGFQVSDKVMVGFTYDREITGLGNTSFNDGSFEFMLRFELFSKYNKLISPRFF